MAAKIRGNTDPELDAVGQALAAYEAEHPQAEIEAYRQNSVSLRIRIIDPDFAGVSRAVRHDTVWRFLETLPEKVQSDISVLLLLTPEERRGSFASVEFDAPIPSHL